jgi:putative transposase
MARRRRVEMPGGLYHVIVRGNERRAVFRDDADRERYLSRLKLYRERFGVGVLAYCLMDNHVHLALERGKVPLSRVMLALQGSYTQGFNRRHGRVGHLFQGRYKAFLVDKDTYVMALLRYIHRNPVEAGLVARPEQYAWSSAPYYWKGKGPGWLDVDRGLSLLGGSRSKAVRRYRRLMGEEEAEPYEQIQGVAQVIKGDEAFARHVLEAMDDRELIRRSLRVASVARTVAEAERMDLAYLRGLTRRRDASLARALVGHLAKTYGRIPYAATAAFFNREPSTLARDIRRLESLLPQKRSLREKVAQLANRILAKV